MLIQMIFPGARGARGPLLEDIFPVSVAVANKKISPVASQRPQRTHPLPRYQTALDPRLGKVKRV